MTTDGWTVKLYTMFISCKHTGTGSLNKKKLITEKHVLRWAYPLLRNHFWVKTLQKMNFQSKPPCVRLAVPNDDQHSVNEVRGVYLESIEQLHYRRYKRRLQLMSQLMTPPRSALLIVAWGLLWVWSLCKDPGAHWLVTKVKANSTSAWKNYTGPVQWSSTALMAFKYVDQVCASPQISSLSGLRVSSLKPVFPVSTIKQQLKARKHHSGFKITKVPKVPYYSHF